MSHLYSLLGCLFPIPRILYAMSSDGLLFGFLSNINEKTKTPVVATAVCGFGAGKYVHSNGFPNIQYFIVLTKRFFQVYYRPYSILNNSSTWRPLAPSYRT